jgi:hypothetical protein
MTARRANHTGQRKRTRKRRAYQALMPQYPAKTHTQTAGKASGAEGNRAKAQHKNFSRRTWDFSHQLHQKETQCAKQTECPRYI